jgi:hypothetical protein
MSRITNKDIERKLRLIERLLRLNKGVRFNLEGAYGKVKITYPGTYNNFTGLMSKRELYDTLDNYVKGLEDGINRVKVRAKINKQAK